MPPLDRLDALAAAAPGQIKRDAPLAPYTWFRVGGAADVLFLPKSEESLVAVLRATDSVPVTVLGVASNTLVRDGGVEGLVIRMAGAAFGQVKQTGPLEFEAGAGALDLSVARAAAKAGVAGLEFLSGIPGSLGGALQTNAGCYGRELRDILVHVDGVLPTGETLRLAGPLQGGTTGDAKLDLSYRSANVPTGFIATRFKLRGAGSDDPENVMRRMAELQAGRENSQPVKSRTGGSTFANPDPPGAPNQRSAWKLIDAAGCRGLRVGGAMVSETHCNFLINTGDASAADIEALGELVRARVVAETGVRLRWEIRRIGRLQPRLPG